MKEERNYLTPYNYVQNNPVNRIDPTGALDEDPPENNEKADSLISVGTKLLQESKYQKNHAYYDLKDVKSAFLWGVVPYDIESGSELDNATLEAIYGRGVTWCNQFTYDFTWEITNENPWVGFYKDQNNKWYTLNGDKEDKANANRMNIMMDMNLNDAFMKVPLSEAWDFANEGSIVYLSWFNPAKRKDGSMKSGHISIARPTEKLHTIEGYKGMEFGDVMQAGATVSNKLKLFYKRGEYKKSPGVYNISLYNDIEAYVLVSTSPRAQVIKKQEEMRANPLTKLEPIKATKVSSL